MEELLINFLKSGNVLMALDKFLGWYQKTAPELKQKQITTLPEILELYFKSDECEFSGWLYDWETVLS